MTRFGILVAFVLLVIAFVTSRIYSIGLRLDTVGTRIFFFIFLFVPVLFIGSIMLGRSGQINPTLYREIQLLAGAGFYVALGSALLALILIVFHFAHIPYQRAVGWSIIGLSLVVAFIGYVQSTYIKVTTYTVSLPHAPASWENKTAVLVSDTHFGLVNHKTFSNKVVDRIIELHPDFVLHAGDFYDGPAIDTTQLTQSWKRLAAVTHVFYAPGNHEEYGNYAGFLDSIKSAGVTVLDNKKTLYDGVQIAGITYHEGKNSPAAAEAINNLTLDPHTPVILINHPPTALAAAEGAGVDLQVSGHTHNGQFWPMTYLVRKIYGQYYYGNNAYQNMQVITSSGIGTFGPPFRLFNTPELVLITFHTQ